MRVNRGCGVYAAKDQVVEGVVVDIISTSLSCSRIGSNERPRATSINAAK